MLKLLYILACEIFLRCSSSAGAVGLGLGYTRLLGHQYLYIRVFIRIRVYMDLIHMMIDNFTNGLKGAYTEQIHGILDMVFWTEFALQCHIPSLVCIVAPVRQILKLGAAVRAPGPWRAQCI